MLKRISWLLLALVFVAWAQQKITIVNYVKAALAVGDFASAEKGLAQYRAAAGATPEYIEALSWIGRGRMAVRGI